MTERAATGWLISAESHSRLGAGTATTPAAETAHVCVGRAFPVGPERPVNRARDNTEKRTMTMPENDMSERVQSLETAQAVQVATQTGAQATQAATQAGQAATTAAAHAGTWATMGAGGAGLIVGMFLGLAIAKS